MGTLVSKAKLLLYASVQLSKKYEILRKRIQTSPGLPVLNPTLPYWTVPAAPVPREPPDVLPSYADVVVIGSGITGTSFAYNALTQENRLKVVMLDARDVCSGATGRNGGHINPPLYHDYLVLKAKHGASAAAAMLAFRLSHLSEFYHVATSEGILKESQWRETEHLDVFTCPKAFAEAKENLAKWKADMPLESSSFVCYEGEEAIKKFRLSDAVIGCISNAGGAMHPYRYVTSLLAILLARHVNNFHIYPHTPCTSISADKNTNSGLYIVHTPRGIIRTRHVVHATNGWCAHLLPPLLTKIVPSRGGMSAQRPGTTLHPSTLSGYRSFVFYRGGVGYDYLTQLPTGEHELMFGGGWASTCDTAGLPDIGLTDDSVVNHLALSYLGGALPRYFGPRSWGADARPLGDREGGGGEEGEWALSRTKAEWSGILAISADMLPWVGRLPEKVSGRTQPKSSYWTLERCAGGKEEGEEVRTVAPGEWIAAGYSGEGMVHAWMSGKALAHMVLDREEGIDEWFPDVLRVTEKRWKEANIEVLFSRLV